MGTWKKTNEAYFADSFNRDGSIAAYATATTAHADGLASVAKGLTLPNCNDIGLNSCKVDSGLTYNYAVKSEVNTIQQKLEKLQEQIDSLKKRQTITSELRSALKTLHYKREIE